MKLPPNQQASLPLDPGAEALRDPATLGPPKSATVLGLRLLAVGFVWRDQLDALFTKLRIQWIAVVRLVADQDLRLCLDHVEVEGQLYERHFMMVRRVRGDRQRQALAIHNCHDFHAFSALCRANLLPAALRRSKGGVDVALRLVNPAFP